MRIPPCRWHQAGLLAALTATVMLTQTACPPKPDTRRPRPNIGEDAGVTRLQPDPVAGPALVEEYSGTTLVPPDWKATVTHGGHLLLEL